MWLGDFASLTVQVTLPVGPLILAVAVSAYCMVRWACLAYRTVASRKVLSCNDGDPIDQYIDRIAVLDFNEFANWMDETDPLVVTRVSSPSVWVSNSQSSEFLVCMMSSVIDAAEGINVKQSCEQTRRIVYLKFGNIFSYHTQCKHSWIRYSRKFGEARFELGDCTVAETIQPGDVLLLSSITSRYDHEVLLRWLGEFIQKMHRSVKDEFATYLKLQHRRRLAWYLYSSNVRTILGIKITFSAVVVVIDQILDVVNAVQNYFSNGAHYPVIGSVSVSLFLAPSFLHWLVEFMIGNASVLDLFLKISGLQVPTDCIRSILHGVKLPGLFWGSVFEGIIEAPSQALLNLYTLEIGLIPLNTIGIASCAFSVFMVAKNLSELDQYGTPHPWTTAAQIRNFVERLAEVSFRIVSVAMFLAVMRPDVPMGETRPIVMLVFFLVEVSLCGVLVCRATAHHMCTLKILWVVMSMLARPPYFLVELRQLYSKVLGLRLLEAGTMAWIVKCHGHRSPSRWEFVILSTTAIACVVCLAMRLLEWACVSSVYASLPENEALTEVNAMLVQSMEDSNPILAKMSLASGANPEQTMVMPLVELRGSAGDTSWNLCPQHEWNATVSVLLWAVKHDKLNLVRPLLQHAADANMTATAKVFFASHHDDDLRASQRVEERSALTLAIMNGSLDMVQLLLQGGARPDMVLRMHDREAYAPDGAHEVREVLLSIKDEEHSALSCAVKNGSAEIIQVLLQAGARADMRLHYHCRYHEPSVFRGEVMAYTEDELGPVVKRKDRDETAVDIARSSKPPEVLEALLSFAGDSARVLRSRSREVGLHESGILLPA